LFDRRMRSARGGFELGAKGLRRYHGNNLT